MNNTDTAFFREIDESENDCFHKSGNIQRHNGELCKHFDYLSHLDDTVKYNDDFYRILRRTVRKTDEPPLFIIIAMYFFAATFSSMTVFSGATGAAAFGFIAFSVFLFCAATCLLVYRTGKRNRIFKCIKQAENVCTVSLKIDGTRSFDDTHHETISYYIYSEPYLIDVPKKLFDKATPGKRVVGAVVDIGNKKLFYVLYVI